jgi:hypothetical protein
MSKPTLSLCLGCGTRIDRREDAVASKEAGVNHSVTTNAQVESRTFTDRGRCHGDRAHATFSGRRGPGAAAPSKGENPVLKAHMLSLATAGAFMSSAALAAPDQEALNALGAQLGATTLQATTQMQTEAATQCRPSQLNGRWAMYLQVGDAGAECFIDVSRGSFSGPCEFTGFESSTGGTLRLARNCRFSGRFRGSDGTTIDGTLQPNGQAGAGVVGNNRDATMQGTIIVVRQ